MYKKVRRTKNAEINQDKVDLIKKVLVNYKKSLIINPKIIT